MLGVIDRYGNSYLRRTDHIDGSLVALEDFEYLAEETVCQQHAARFNLNGSNITLGSNSLDLALFGIIGNQCTRGMRIHRVQQANRYVGILSRLDTSRV